MAELNSIPGSGSGNRAKWAAETAATVKLAAPIALAFLAEIGIVVADAVMAGKLGTAALAAEGLGAHLLFTPQLLAMGVLSSIAALGAHADGAEDPAMVTRVSRQGLWLATLLSLPVMAVIAVTPGILALSGRDPEILEMTRGMMFAGLTGVPALLWYTALRNFATVLHRTRIVVIISLLSLGVAIGSNWVFLYGNLGAPKLGVTGVGISWSLASWVQLAVMYVYVKRQPLLARYRVLGDLLHADWKVLKDLFHVGWPISMSYAFETALFLASSLMMAWISPDALAAHTVVISISSVSYMIPYGLSQAATVRVGFCTGAEDAEGARRAGFVAIGLGIVWMLGTGLTMNTWPEFLIGLYFDPSAAGNQGSLAIALMIIPIGALFQVVDGMQCTAIGALRGLKDTRVPMIMCFIGYCVIGALTSLLLAFALGFGPHGVWFGLFIGLFASAVFLTVRFQNLSRRFVAEGAGALVPSRAG
ncbi:MAG TPA: MATE family efflux transporter [Dongiaceae bacterium]|jgi:MATE family multidrug resistance protein|nr:MATE family efflux transporter [Dongiaceae bacterium]